MSEQQLIDSIFEVRVRNNIPWKRLMEIALKHAPDETRAALREINENDLRVSYLLHELAADPTHKTTEDELGA